MSIQQQEKEITRKNLERVLRELPLLVEKNRDIKYLFNMYEYGAYVRLTKENLNKCKTVGCLLGNSARIFEKEFTDDLFIDNKFKYTLFGIKFFPYLYDESDNRTVKWEYLFDSEWVYYKFRELEDGLNRIQNLLDNNLECNEFSFETNQIIN